MNVKFNHTEQESAIASYVAFLSVEPGEHERRRQIIEEVVWECDTRYRRLMYTVIRVNGVGHEDAEDILQNILMRWSQRLDTAWELPAPEKLKAYFRKVARNAALTHLRRLSRKRRDAETESARRRFVAEQRSLLADLALGELPKVIDRILMTSAAPEAWLVFKLRQQGLTYRDISAELEGMSAERGRFIMGKVLVLLREELARRGWSRH